MRKIALVILWAVATVIEMLAWPIHHFAEKFLVWSTEELYKLDHPEMKS